jgi:hypothetical protein
LTEKIREATEAPSIPEQPVTAPVPAPDLLVDLCVVCHEAITEDDEWVNAPIKGGIAHAECAKTTPT